MSFPNWWLDPVSKIIGILQLAAAAFPTRILIEILEEFLSHLMYLPLKFPTSILINSDLNHSRISQEFCGHLILEDKSDQNPLKFHKNSMVI